MKRLAVLLAAAALASAPTAAGARPATAQNDYAKQAVHATNKQRTHNGLRALRTDKCLRTYAARQAQLMADQETLFHQDLRPILRACGVSSAGENIASGYPSGKSVVVDGWMNSPPHRANILNRRYRTIAIAARLGQDGQWYVSQVFGGK